MSSGRRMAMIAIGGLLAWYICTLVFWAFQPLTENVPVGVDYTRKNPREISVAVKCSTLFRATSRRSSPLPALTAQPVGKPPLAYAYDPCIRTHRQARALFVLDTAVVLAGVALAVWLTIRQRVLVRPARVGPSRM
jgi:hypothetical protein